MAYIGLNRKERDFVMAEPEVKALAYKLDPDCWVSYSGRPPEVKRWMDRRRTASLALAEKQLQLQPTMETRMTDTPVSVAEGGEYFCVIGVSVTENHPIKRSWKKTHEAAAKHAEKLINDSFTGTTHRTKKLLVVKVVEVIEVPTPSLRRRAVKGEDVGIETPEDE